MDVLGPFPAMKPSNRYILVLEDHQTKLTRIKVVITVTSMSAKTVLLNSWVIPHDISTYLQTNKELQFGK